MRRATAVRRLRTIAQRCQQVCGLWDPGAGLVAVHAFGRVLDGPGDGGDGGDGGGDGGDGGEPSIEVVQIALVVAEPAELVTWGARPPAYAGLPYVLELEKAPVDWYYRPASGPVGNHRIDRPLRIWSRAEGVDDDALGALAAGRAGPLRESRPRPEALRRQVVAELDAAERHLRTVRDRYWQRGWRSDHHGAGSYPENHLWDALNGYLDLLDAERALQVRPAPEPP